MLSTAPSTQSSGMKNGNMQAIHRFNGEEHHSNIVWTNSEVTGIRQTACDQSRFNGKYLDHGRPVIIRNGEKYSMDGLRRK